MIKYIISCEHGGHKIPADFQAAYSGYGEVLKSHRGWDKGALECAKFIAERSHYPLYYSKTCRLLIELNRSLAHPQLFSEISAKFSAGVKQALIDDYYLPYRDELENKIAGYIDKGHQVIHLSIHSFTPILNGEIRKTEIGLLFDPVNQMETKFAEKWKKSIEKEIDIWRVKFNYPYLGTDDGLTSYFRDVFPVGYAGIELEINTKLMDTYPIHQISNWVLPPMGHK